jgi:hypothetical protein
MKIEPASNDHGPIVQPVHRFNANGPVDREQGKNANLTPA